MQSPKGQDLNSVRMNNEKPLLKLKGSPFFIISMWIICSAVVLLFLYFMLIYKALDRYPGENIFLSLVCLLIIIIIIVMIEVLVIVELYPDRIERYYLGGFRKKIIYLKDVDIHITHEVCYRGGRLHVMREGSYFGGMVCYFGFIGGVAARKKFIECCKSIGMEFVDKTNLLRYSYFIKKK